MKLLNLFKRNRAPAEPAGALTSSESDTGSPGVSSPVEVSFENAVKVTAYEQLPAYRTVLTAITGALPIPEAQYKDVALLGLDDKRAAMVCSRAYFGSTRFFSLCERVSRLGISIPSYIVAEDPGILLIVYSKYTKLAESSTGDIDFNSDSAQLFEEIITRAVLERASDVHLAVREETGAVLYRIDGVVVQARKLPASLINETVGFAYTKLAEESSRSHPTYNFKAAQSCSVVMRNVGGRNLKLRYQSIPVTGGFDVILRVLFTDDSANKTLSLEALGYSDSQVRQLDLAARKAVGAVFVAGVTGSGKTTTLKTLMTRGHHRLQLKSYSVEDPAEYKMYGVSQISVQRDSTTQELGSNPFISAMRTVMRADPDMIMVGEVRDTESGSLVKTMIQSGHKVYTTVHASSAIELIERLTSDEIGLSRQTLSARNFVNAFVYQRLVRLTCPHCGLPGEGHLDADLKRLIVEKFGISLDKVRIINEQGCQHCKHRGYMGQTVAAEIIVPDTRLLRLIREGKDLEAEEYWRGTRTARFDDPDCMGKTAFEHALYKMSQGLIDPNVLESDFEPLETYYIPTPGKRGT